MHALLARQVAVSVTQLHDCSHTAAVATWLPQKQQKHHEHICAAGAPRKPSAWGRSDSHELLRRGELYFSVCSGKGKEHLNYPSSPHQAADAQVLGFLCPTKLTQSPLRALVSSLATPGIDLLCQRPHQ